jgi:ABC-type dipeptide/oligopeptide/nickel transport system permease component
MNLGYLARRIALALPVLFGVSIVSFLLLRVIPGDPARLMAGPDADYAQVQLIRHQMGLDVPLPQQYLLYLGGLFHGDLGMSTREKAPVAQILAGRFPFTLELTVAALALSLLAGIASGIAAATRKGGIADQVVMVLSLTSISMPSFWLGLMLIGLFAVWLGLLPTGGADSPAGVILPAVTLALGEAGAISRVTRASMLEVIKQDFIRTAQAKGVGRRAIVVRHVLTNALTPILTLSGLHFGFLLGGAVVTETVFAWPGLGQLLIESISYRDYPVIQAILLLLAAEFVLVNLLVDALYSVVDPRVRHGDAH